MRTFYWLAGIGLLILVLWGGGKYFANQKIGSLIDKANKDGNILEIKGWSTSFRIISLGLEVDSIRLNQRVGKQRISGSVKRVALNDLNVFSLAFGNVPELDGLVVKGPDLLISPASSSDNFANDASSGKGQKSPVKLGKVTISDGRLYRGNTRETAKMIGYGIDVESDGMSLPPDTTSLATLVVTVDSLHLPRNNQPTELWVRGLEIADGKALSVNQITLEPKQTQKTFLTTIETRQPWNALRLDSISSSALDLSKILSPDSVTNIKRLKIGNLDFLVYENPDLPRPDHEPRKSMPVEILRDMPLGLKIDKVELPNVKVTYGVTDQSGTSSKLTFSKGEVVLSNVQTTHSNDPLVIEANFLFDLAARINARFELDQNGNGRDFSMSGTMGDYYLPQVNPLMKIAAKAIVKDGQVHGIDYEARVENEVAKGELMFKYSDLSVKLTGNGAFFKNLLKGVAMRKDNPKSDGDLRRGQIYHEHPPERPFFNLYWKSIVSGLSSTAVGNLFIKEEMESEEVE